MHSTCRRMKNSWYFRCLLKISTDTNIFESWHLVIRDSWLHPSQMTKSKDVVNTTNQLTADGCTIIYVLHIFWRMQHREVKIIRHYLYFQYWITRRILLISVTIFWCSQFNFGLHNPLCIILNDHKSITYASYILSH